MTTRKGLLTGRYRMDSYKRSIRSIPVQEAALVVDPSSQRDRWGPMGVG